MAHILLLEPNTLLSQTYTTALQHDGHSVAAAAGAQAGISAADEHMPDVIVLELQMPRHNGVEFLYELRSYREWQGIPVVVHTALTPPRVAAVEEILRNALGVRAVLYKPTTALTDLLRTVREQLVTA
jgi:CheY-like chemotaxis protein